MTSDDLVGAGDRWIPERDYEYIKSRVPILGVDLILLSNDQPPRVGLIRRETYAGAQGWCLVGGAVLRDEPLTAAVERHLHATLGSAVELDMATIRLLDVIEYFTKPGIGEFHDPRKHSVALTYFGLCGGRVQPCGEALGFQWFQQKELEAIPFGFGQGAVISRFLALNNMV
jgi:ADP-ribose pyrophosphatase YjhB (NUDIX family)